MGSPLYRSARPAPQDDSASRALRTKVERNLASVRTLHETQAAIILQMRRSLAALERVPSDLYSRKWFEQRQDEIRAEAQRALDDAELAAQERIESAREMASAAATREAPANTAEAMLLEAQKQNAWASIRQLLESAAAAMDPIKAIEQVCERIGADSVRLAALKEYSGDWAAAYMAGKPRREQQRLQDVLTASIDQAELPTLTPVQRAAREVLQDIDQGTSRLQVGTNEARREIAGRGQIAAAIPGWSESTPTILLTHKGMPIPVEADSIVSAAFGPEAQAFSIAAPKNYPLLSEQGALQGTVLDPSPRAQMLRSMGMNVASDDPNQE